MPDGNCLYRSIFYFLFNRQQFYTEIKQLVIDLIENNYYIFLSFFEDLDSKNIKKDTLVREEYEYSKKKILGVVIYKLIYYVLY